MAQGYIRNELGLIEGHYLSATDALLVAIAELKKTGGGMVWIHRSDCLDPTDNEECLCYPVSLFVPSDQSN
jgi:uncharacterized protein (DUF779 family)